MKIAIFLLLCLSLNGCVREKQYVQKDITVEVHMHAEQKTPLNISLDLGNAVGVEKK